MSKYVDTKAVKSIYENSAKRISAVKEQTGKPLTLTEKILFSHAYRNNFDANKVERGVSDIDLAPDRVCMQDATAQMAILQFISVGVGKVATPTSVHCDHLIRAKEGAEKDLETAKTVNKEVYDFLSSASKKYGMDFWKPGAGIIHQIFLENYAFPGGMVIGTDSHTPTGGGLGMVAIGVGGADAVDVMTKQPWQLKSPKVIGVHLKGKMSGWTSPKDVILKLCGILSVKGGTGKILEYFGEGCESISCTGKSTITNMGAELGATTSLFPYDSRMADFLRATDRAEVAELADEYREILTADAETAQNPSEYYDEVIEIDLSTLEPAANGPHTPDAYYPLSEMKEKYPALNLPEHIAVCLIGSCTNSSYEDISRAAAIADHAHKNGLKLKSGFMISPGSNLIAETMKRDGFTEIFEKVGGTVLSNSCGPCIGQWDRSDIKKGEKNVIVNSFNRNFKKRNDGNEETYAFVASPEMVTAFAFAGNITFDPRTDTLTNQKGEEVKLHVPQVDDLPKQGYAKAEAGCEPPAADGSALKVEVDQASERIQLLEAFPVWNTTEDFNEMPILVKALGKCTTDHISPAGPWLKYRGHIDNISPNMYSGAVNAFHPDKTGEGKNVISGEFAEYNEVARDYKKDGITWAVIGDENYGEGSSREHAAMEPRFLGCGAVITKSFARIAETNLKKQGVLPLTLQNVTDYDIFQETDRIAIHNLDKLEPNVPLVVTITHEDGSSDEITVDHSLNPEQIKWFYAGSALNKAGKDLKEG
jgi:aconitate hydratase